MSKGIVYFAHGKESGPRGRKITYLGGICRELGWRIESPDYSDLGDPEARVQHLLEACRANSAVDAIQQRARDPRSVAVDLFLGTLAAGLAQVTAGAGVHCHFAIDAPSAKT